VARRTAAVLHRSQDSAQDVGLILIELSALQKTADAHHQVSTALRTIPEVDLLQDFCQMSIQALHLDRRCQRHLAFRRNDGRAPSHEQLIGHELDGHRQIQGKILRVRRNADQQVGRLQIRIGEPGALGPKEHRRWRSLSLTDDTFGRIARIRNANIRIAIARRRGSNESTIGNRLTHRLHDTRATQDVIGSGGPRCRLGVREELRPHEDELIERHVFHRPRGRPDVTGVGGLDQHDTNVAGLHLIGYVFSRELKSIVHALLNIAVKAARRAGEVIVRSLNRLESLTVTSKGRNDFVSEVDRAAEAEIIAIIRKHYPNHAFLAEESGTSGEGETVWIIDPLDGTTNFLHGFPTFAVSIACQQRGRLEHAVVYDPMRQELFTSTRGNGSHLDNRRMRVSSAGASSTR